MKYDNILPGTHAYLVLDSGRGLIVALVRLTARGRNPSKRYGHDPDKDHVYFDVIQELEGTVEVEDVVTGRPHAPHRRPGYPVAWFAAAEASALRAKVLELFQTRRDARALNLRQLDLSLRHHRSEMSKLENERIRLDKLDGEDAERCGSILAGVDPWGL